MKRSILVILCVVIIIIAVFSMKYVQYTNAQNEIKEENLEYEMYLNTETTGTELTSIIDKAIDNNERNSVEKDEDGFYIENNENSIKIDVKMLDDDGNIYKMETIYSGGMGTFNSYYNDIKFMCTTIEYNDVGRVSYMLFEQITS